MNPSKDKKALFSADDAPLHATGVLTFARQLFTPDKPEGIQGPDKFGATIFVPLHVKDDAPETFKRLVKMNLVGGYMKKVASDVAEFLTKEKNPRATNPDSPFYKGKLPSGKQSPYRAVPDDHALNQFGTWAKVVAKSDPAKCGGVLKFFHKNNTPMSLDEAKELIVDGAIVTLTATVLVSIDRENVSAQIGSIRLERGPLPETEGLGGGRNAAPPAEIPGLDDEDGAFLP